MILFARTLQLIWGRVSTIFEHSYDVICTGLHCLESVFHLRRIAQSRSPGPKSVQLACSSEPYGTVRSSTELCGIMRNQRIYAKSHCIFRSSTEVFAVGTLMQHWSRTPIFGYWRCTCLPPPLCGSLFNHHVPFLKDCVMIF